MRVQEVDDEEDLRHLQRRLLAESRLLPLVIETLSFLTESPYVDMERAAAGTFVAQLGIAGGSLRRWAEIVSVSRVVLMRKVMDEDLRREELRVQAPSTPVVGEEFDFDGNTDTN